MSKKVKPGPKKPPGKNNEITYGTDYDSKKESIALLRKKKKKKKKFWEQDYLSSNGIAESDGGNDLG